MASNTSQLTLHWFLPTYGDSRGIMAGGLGTQNMHGEREATMDYLTQVVEAAEHNGFESVLTPSGLWCEDAWLIASGLAARTKRLKFLIAVRPGLVSPTMIGQQGQTFQKLFDNRLLINVVIGGEDHEQRAFGDHLSKKERYARGSEVLTVTDHLWKNPEPITFQGEYINIEGAQLKGLPEVAPPVMISGSSPEGIECSAKHGDVYLTWGEPPAPAGEKIAKVRDRAAELGRELGYGLRVHIIARPTAEEAWREAQRLVDALDVDKVRAMQESLARSQSEGQRRMQELHGMGSDFRDGIDARELEIYPNLWAGIGLARSGTGTALVGSYEQVAQRMKEYMDLGFDNFVLSGYPHLEETYQVGEGVVPELQKLGITVTNHEHHGAVEGEDNNAAK